MKATITFIPHDIFRRGQNLAMQPVTAIYLLGQILIDNGIDTRILDPYELRNMSTYSYTEISDTVIGDSEILFFSSNSYNWANTKRVIEIIKANRPEISIVVGGIHPTMMDMRVMNTTPVDVIIRGEGERSIVEVARSMLMKELELSSIDGITYRDSNGHIIRNKDARPLTEEEYAIYNANCCFNKLPAGEYRGIPCETSRGCRYNCAFCGIWSHGAWKSLNIVQIKEKLSQTIACMKEKTRNGIVTITDDCFTADRMRLLEVLYFLSNISQGCDLVMEGRLNEIVDPNVIKAIKKNPIRRFLVGIECGYDEGLRRVRKGYTTETIEKYLEIVKASGLSNMVYCSFIIMFPWETEEECLKTIHFAARLVERYGVQSNISIWNIIPSELWDQREQYGLNVDADFFESGLLGKQEDYEKYLVSIHPVLTEKSYRKIKKAIAMYIARGINLINN